MRNRFIPKILFLCLILVTLTIPAIAQSDHKIHIGFDVLPGDNVVSQRLKVISRYQISSEFSAGLGTAFIYYNDPLSLLPVFVDLKYELMRTNLAPLYF